MKFDEFITGITDPAGALAKTELIGLINAAATDQEEFIKKQGIKLKRYLVQLALGEISKEEYEGYMIDLNDLMRMELLKMEVNAKARAQRIVDGIQNMVFDQLMKLI